MTSPSNKCGSCTACCRVYSIPEFSKPAGPWCQHCTVGKGCKIYETRPARCADFQCLWLQSQEQDAAKPLAPELRPDRCKVVFAPSTNPKVMTAITMPGRPDAWKAPAVRELIDTINRVGMAVAVGPPAADAQLLIEPNGAVFKIRMTPPDKDGMQWSIDR